MEIGVALARSLFFFFFFNDTATTEIYTLSLHDALPDLRTDDPRDQGAILKAECQRQTHVNDAAQNAVTGRRSEEHTSELQSQSTISYAVFCLKKKKKLNLTLQIENTRMLPNLPHQYC